MLLFVYGSLKQGFANEHVNTGRRVPGAYRTQQPWAMYLLGQGQVPCLVMGAAGGTQVLGELYEVTAADLAAMDRLERLGEPQGYDRVEIALERVDGHAPAPTAAATRAWAYVKPAARVPADTPRIGPLAEYTPARAQRFSW